MNSVFISSIQQCVPRVRRIMCLPGAYASWFHSSGVYRLSNGEIYMSKQGGVDSFNADRS
jgi:hypothetical protein